MKPSIRDTMPFYKARNFTNVLGCSLLKPSAGVAEVSIATVEATTCHNCFGDVRRWMAIIRWSFSLCWWHLGEVMWLCCGRSCPAQVVTSSTKQKTHEAQSSSTCLWICRRCELPKFVWVCFPMICCSNYFPANTVRHTQHWMYWKSPPSHTCQAGDKHDFGAGEEVEFFSTLGPLAFKETFSVMTLGVLRTSHRNQFTVFLPMMWGLQYNQVKNSENVFPKYRQFRKRPCPYSYSTELNSATLLHTVSESGQIVEEGQEKTENTDINS